MITTAGCEDLEALITHRALELDEGAFDPSWGEHSLGFSPKLGIYPVLRHNPDILQPATASPIPADSSLARYSEVGVLVEVRRVQLFPPDIPPPVSVHHLPSLAIPSPYLTTLPSLTSS